MSTRPITMLTLALLAVALAGCGMSPRQKMVREQARARLDKVNGQLAYDQAVQAFEAGQFDKARQECEVAMALNPEWAAYRLLSGRIHLETHRLEKALNEFEKALEWEPELAEAHYYSGIVQQRWSDDARAYDHYVAAYELEPDRVSYLLAAAESLVALEQFDAASELIESKLSYFEHNAALRRLMGQIALIQDEAAEAARLLGEARRLNPEDIAILEELVQAQYAAGLYAQCYRSVQQLKEDTRRDREDLLMMEARCLAFMDRTRDARDIYLELSRVRSDSPDVWIELGTLAWELSDFHRVALCGARVTALAPDRYEGYMLKGLNERHHGNMDEAAEFLRQAAERSRQTVLPHLLLGRTLEELGDGRGAHDAYAEALRLEPDNEDARALMAALSGDLGIAVEDPGRLRNE